MTLHALAMQIEANEIVVPDALEDTVETISRAKAFAPYAEPNYKYMGVIQGTTQQEVLKCLNFFDNAPDMQYITCLGVPRVLNKIEPHFRVEFTEFLLANQFHSKFQIHYLGAGPSIREIAALASHVEGNETEDWDSVGFRGHDTSLPIYLGLVGVDVTYGPYHKRPEWYFQSKEVPRPDIMEKNIFKYLTWAGSPDV